MTRLANVLVLILLMTGAEILTASGQAKEGKFGTPRR